MSYRHLQNYRRLYDCLALVWPSVIGQSLQKSALKMHVCAGKGIVKQQNLSENPKLSVMICKVIGTKLWRTSPYASATQHWHAKMPVSNDSAQGSIANSSLLLTQRCQFKLSQGCCTRNVWLGRVFNSLELSGLRNGAKRTSCPTLHQLAPRNAE